MDAKSKLLAIVDRAKGDDLERIERSCAGKSDAELDTEYGPTGLTDRMYLDEARAARADWQAARDLADGTTNPLRAIRNTARATVHCHERLGPKTVESVLDTMRQIVEYADSYLGTEG